MEMDNPATDCNSDIWEQIDAFEFNTRQFLVNS
jgi:hypothetical protein